MSPRTAAAQSASVPVAIATGAGLEPWISLGLGILGVILARVAFTTRQQRSGEKVSLLETIVITGMAMIIVGPIVWEYQLGMTTSALLGIGAGWSSIALFDVIGEKAILFISGLFGTTPKPSVPTPAPVVPTLPTLPADMEEDLRKLDQLTADRPPPPLKHLPPDEG